MVKKQGLGAIVTARLENARYTTGFRGQLIEDTTFRYVVLPAEGAAAVFELGGDFGCLRESAK